MKRRDFNKLTALTTGLTALSSVQAVAKNQSKSMVYGHGAFRYRQVPNWGVLDKSTPVKDCHEMVQDSKGRLILLTNHTKNNIIIYDKSGKLLDKWGTDFPGAHGLSIAKENGEDVLFITDPDRHQVFKMSTDGKLIRKFEFPEASGYYEDPLLYKPTEVAVAPNGDFYVADGYGSQFVIHYNSKGEVVRFFGGRGDNPENLSQAHGICYDDRDKKNPTLLVTDRTKNCFKRFSLDGKYIGTIEIPGAYVCRPVIHGENIYAAVLISHEPWESATGFVVILDRNDKVVSCPNGGEPIYENGKLQTLYQSGNLFMHPHDVCVDNDRNLYVTQWNSKGVYPIKLERI